MRSRAVTIESSEDVLSEIGVQGWAYTLGDGVCLGMEGEGCLEMRLVFRFGSAYRLPAHLAAPLTNNRLESAVLLEFSLLFQLVKLLKVL